MDSFSDYQFDRIIFHVDLWLAKVQHTRDLEFWDEGPTMY
jgi:hypothetical protein